MTRASYKECLQSNSYCCRKYFSYPCHNHYQSGTAGLKDVWLMKSPHKRQSGGISEFCFTNAYLAMNYFTKKKMQPNNQFKITASITLARFKLTELHQTRQLNVTSEQALHSPDKLPYSKNCLYS